MIETSARRRALGRGLGALIPSVAPAEEKTVETVVPLAAIQPNPHQPRQRFVDAAIDELAESIKQKGILQPLLVRRVGSGYELIAGERRLRAAQRLGLKEVPINIREADDGEMLELALIENIQRENLNPLEEARAYRQLMQEFRLTQEEIATRVAKDRSTIANTLRLLQLPDEIKAEIEHGTLSAGHARTLLGLDEHKAKLALAREIVSRRLTVRQAEQLAKRHARPLADIEQRAAEQRLTEALGTKVRVLPRRNGSGKIEIEYYSLDGLNGLLDRLTDLRTA